MCGWKGQMNEMGKKESCRKMVRSGLTDPRFTPSFHQTRARDLGLRFLSMRAVMGSTAPWLSRLLCRHYGQLRLWGAEKARAQSGKTGKERGGLYYAILLRCPSLGFQMAGSRALGLSWV